MDERQHAAEKLLDLGSRICLGMAYIAALRNKPGLAEGKYDKIAETVSYKDRAPYRNASHPMDGSHWIFIDAY